MGKVKGLDVGTMSLVGAEQDDEGKIKLKLMRHTFLDIEANVFTKNMLKKQKAPYVEMGNKLYVLGGSAFDLANIMNKVVRRPMQDGLISPGEADAVPICGLLVEAVLGKPDHKDQLCYFSVPADPVGANFNIAYHTSVISGALKTLGYVGKPMNEGHAVVFAELGDKDFTGIGISVGGGMSNICVSYKAIPAIGFSTSRAGDWIDRNVAQVLGIKAPRAMAIKEKGININKPANREEEAVGIYYRNLINYTLTNIKNKFEKAEQMPQFPEAIEIVCAGGSSMIGGFVDVFREELKKIAFPIEIANVRLAEEPLYATARGCLLAGLIKVE